ncbi:MAG: hypothetical protein JOZ72_18145 [Alphaproteobacteria bacterium]|nr:hypothetical protein [Alphaproteobacteria bacterium]
MIPDELEKAIIGLAREDRARLKAFLKELDALEFDVKIERDAERGALDHALSNSEEDFCAGRCREL